VRLVDVNVLVYAHREDTANHLACRRWVEAMLASDEAYAVSELVLSGFLRVVTHPRVFKKPSPIEAALRFADQIRDQPQCALVAPGPRHWEIFARLCRVADARGNLVPDAYLAALAIESGCEWITTDRDYGRFPGLKWSPPEVQ
jgi:toxin-antitoxin system PIN domain toxin